MAKKKAAKRSRTKRPAAKRGGVLSGGGRSRPARGGRVKPLDVNRYRKSAQRASGGLDYLTLTEGANVVRIIPFEHNGQVEMAVEAAMHYGIGPQERSVICPRVTVGERCPVCDLVEQAPDEYGDMRAKARWFFHVLDRNDEKAGLQVLGCGSMIFGPITELLEDPDIGTDLLNVKSGFDIVIMRTGSGRRGTRYSVRPRPKKSTVPSEFRTPGDLFDKVHIRDAKRIEGMLAGEDDD